MLYRAQRLSILHWCTSFLSLYYIMFILNCYFVMFSEAFSTWNHSSNCDEQTQILFSFLLSNSMAPQKRKHFKKINVGELTFTTVSLCPWLSCIHLPHMCLPSFLWLTRPQQFWEAGACSYMWKAPLINACLSRGGNYRTEHSSAILNESVPECFFMFVFLAAGLHAWWHDAC